MGNKPTPQKLNNLIHVALEHQMRLWPKFTSADGSNKVEFFWPLREGTGTDRYFMKDSDIRQIANDAAGPVCSELEIKPIHYGTSADMAAVKTLDDLKNLISASIVKQEKWGA
ncbi:hypothetical protein [Brevundimonas aveniformis]|uniref:hypothetical protein n=1 Tax=Brevundimonas aveniformis TaxID=370977 RepID=UPI0004211448|nr:hypothetical protein [Brevundimonas aveniformis]